MELEGNYPANNRSLLVSVLGRMNPIHTLTPNVLGLSSDHSGKIFQLKFCLYLY